MCLWHVYRQARVSLVDDLSFSLGPLTTHEPACCPGAPPRDQGPKGLHVAANPSPALQECPRLAGGTPGLVPRGWRAMSMLQQNKSPGEIKSLPFLGQAHGLWTARISSGSPVPPPWRTPSPGRQGWVGSNGTPPPQGHASQGWAELLLPGPAPRPEQSSGAKSPKTAQKTLHYLLFFKLSPFKKVDMFF